MSFKGFIDPFAYHTIKAPAEGQYKEKGSKFLGFVYPVSSEEMVKSALLGIKKEYFDARHHCYGFVLGPGKEKFRAFDDGEPHHSAGEPILGQIRSKDLTDTLVVVVRYFGGIKLGVSGLTAAYREAARDTLNHATIISVDVTRKLEVTFDYDSMPDIMRLVKEFKMLILEQDFGSGSRLKLEVKLRTYDSILSRLQLLKALGKKVEIATG